MASSNTSRINRCDFFLMVWVLYYLQGVVYPVDGAVFIAILGLNILVSAICCFKVLQWKYTSIYFRGFNYSDGYEAWCDSHRSCVSSLFHVAGDF